MTPERTVVIVPDQRDAARSLLRSFVDGFMDWRAWVAGALVGIALVVIVHAA